MKGMRRVIRLKEEFGRVNILHEKCNDTMNGFDADNDLWCRLSMTTFKYKK